jgi:hypothetical protein
MYVKVNTVFSGKGRICQSLQKPEWLLEEGDRIPQIIGTLHTPNEYISVQRSRYASVAL